MSVSALAFSSKLVDVESFSSGHPPLPQLFGSPRNELEFLALAVLAFRNLLLSRDFLFVIFE